MKKQKIHIFWFRRDLRLHDNVGLCHALQAGIPVLPLFIFDTDILNELERDDPRVTFIHETLQNIHHKLRDCGSGMMIQYGRPVEVWEHLIQKYDIDTVFANDDYEPYAVQRDQQINKLLAKYGIPFKTYKDQVIFEKVEVVKDDGKPYTVYTPYMRRWMSRFESEGTAVYKSEKHLDKLYKYSARDMISLEKIGFIRSSITVPEYRMGPTIIENYQKTRDFPAKDGTSLIGPYLRFGLVGIRDLVLRVKDYNPTYLKELIWREFFMQILFHFPHVVDKSFKPGYDNIPWINDEEHFRRWCEGTTGFPMVDAGMRELNRTGYMHNRVRMVVASFLCKHLLIDWRWGEAYFAKKLLDYELSSNNGNWQWAAGSGCDAAPYFRVFNPAEQVKKFDPDLKYIKKWIPELNSLDYPQPIIDHKFARERAIETYKKALG